MFIENDICYTSINTDEKKVIECKTLKGMILLLTFSNGERKLFDCTNLKGTVFLPLKDETIFHNVKLFHGFPTWNNGEIDIAPETLYEEGIPYNDYDIVFAQSSNCI